MSFLDLIELIELSAYRVLVVVSSCPLESRALVGQRFDDYRFHTLVADPGDVIPFALMIPESKHDVCPFIYGDVMYVRNY